jgi:hypothetical protein
MTKRNIRPRRTGSLPGYQVSFRHPARQGKTVNSGLGTRDPDAARLICADLSMLCETPDLWDEPERALAQGCHRTAVRIFHGVDGARAETPLALFDTLIESLKRRTVTIRALAETAPIALALARDQAERLAQLEDRLKSLGPRIEDLEAENRRLQRRQNLHVRVRLEVAIDRWEQAYREGHAPRTLAEAIPPVRAERWALDYGGQAAEGG